MTMKDFKLENEPKITSGFTTPEGYFDTFSEKILAQLPMEEPKVIAIFTSRKKWLIAAAALLIVALSIPLFNSITATATEEIDAETLENYITYHSGISENDLVDLLENEDLEQIKVDYNVTDSATEEALSTNANLEHYLLN